MIKKILDAFGLLGTARGVKRYLSAEGIWKWRELVPAEAFSESCALAIETLQSLDHDFGDYLEFGVSRGTSLACMHGALRKAGLDHVRLIGFDSFEGLPAEARQEGWAPGDYASTERATKTYLKRAGVDLKNIFLVKGWFRETLTTETKARLGIRKASLIMMDCDTCASTLEALNFCEDLIGDAAMLIFDDWGWKADRGEIGQREAWDEFIKANPHFRVESFPAYIPQARLIHLTRLEETRGSGADERTPERAVTFDPRDDDGDLTSCERAPVL